MNKTLIEKNKENAQKALAEARERKKKKLQYLEQKKKMAPRV